VESIRIEHHVTYTNEYKGGEVIRSILCQGKLVISPLPPAVSAVRLAYLLAPRPPVGFEFSSMTANYVGYKYGDMIYDPELSAYVATVCGEGNDNFFADLSFVITSSVPPNAQPRIGDHARKETFRLFLQTNECKYDKIPTRLNLPIGCTDDPANCRVILYSAKAVWGPSGRKS
jgi:hypothetical protein